MRTDSDHLDETLGTCELCFFSLTKENVNIRVRAPQQFSGGLGGASQTLCEDIWNWEFRATHQRPSPATAFLWVSWPLSSNWRGSCQILISAFKRICFLRTHAKQNRNRNYSFPIRSGKKRETIENLIDPVENGHEEERRQMKRQTENKMTWQKGIHTVSQHGNIKKKERKVIKNRK